MEKSYTIGNDGIPDVDGGFGCVLVDEKEWVEMNWKHNAIERSGSMFGDVLYGEPKPFYRAGKYAYPIAEKALEDFHRAGFVGTVKHREHPQFSDLLNSVCANADAIWLPRSMLIEIEGMSNRHNMKHWWRASTDTESILAGFVGTCGRTRIYTDMFNNWEDHFLNDGMYTLKIRNGVSRQADPLDELRLTLVSGKRGKRLMMEKDVSDQARHIFDLLERCPPPEPRVSSVNWDKMLQE